MKTFKVFETLYTGTVEVPDTITQETLFDYLNEKDCWPTGQEVLSHDAEEVLVPGQTENAVLENKLQACRLIVLNGGCGKCDRVKCFDDSMSTAPFICPGSTAGFWWCCAEDVESAQRFLDLHIKGS